MLENQPDYDELRKAVAKLQEDGLASERSQEPSQLSEEKSLNLREELNPDLLKQKAEQMLSDGLARAKVTFKKALKILIQKAGKEFEGTIEHIQLSENDNMKYLQNFLFVFTTMELGGLGAAAIGVESWSIAILSIFAGGAVGADMSYRFTKMIEK